MRGRQQVAPFGASHTKASPPVSRILSGTVIHLGHTSPCGSCGLPGTRSAGSRRPCLALLRVGFAEPTRLPGSLVGSYPTVSPLPVPPKSPSPVCSLLHFPSGCPAWELPSTLPCGVRTFLGLSTATVRRTRKMKSIGGPCVADLPTSLRRLPRLLKQAQATEHSRYLRGFHRAGR